jgi:hypothetical protein
MLIDNKTDVCQDAEGEDETIVCSDKDNSAQKRNPDTAVWECVGNNNDPKPCGDGLNPGKDRQLLETYPMPICQDADGKSMVPKCPSYPGYGNEFLERDPATGKWISC